MKKRKAIGFGTTAGGKGNPKSQQETDILKRSVAGKTDKAPRAGKRMPLKILWTILALASFWWFSSRSGETTVFRNIVSTLLGWQMDIVLELLGAVAAILIGITFVFLKSQVMTVPRMKLLTDSAAWTSTPPPRDALEKELQVLGFRFFGDFDAAMSAETSIRVRAYADPDRLHGAILMDGKSRGERATVLEFSTKFHPAGSIITNNSPYPMISSYPLDKCVIRMPWKRIAADVLKLHRSLCRTAQEEKFTAEPFSTFTFAEEVIQNTRKDLEYQVKTGRYRKVGEDQYRLSLWGIVIAVPRLWLNMAYPFLFSWYRPPAGFFCWRFRRRLKKLKLQTEKNSALTKSDAKDNETPEHTSKAISAEERKAPSVKM